MLLLAVPAPSQPARRQLLHGHVPEAAANLTPIGRLAATQRLALAIGLPLRNEAALGQLLQELYDPASANYRQFLTLEQFTEQFGPSESDYQAVIRFAAANGLTVTATYPNRTVLNVNGAVADIEKAFHVSMRVYRHPKENRTFYSPDIEPSLDLAVPVADISGLNDFALPHPNLKPIPALLNPAAATPNAGSGPGGNFLGYDFRRAYAPGVSLTGAGQMVGLLEFDGYFANDITNYQGQAGLTNLVPLQNILVDSVSGIPGYSGDPRGVGEVSLDIEMAIAMAPGLSKVVVIEGNLGNSVLASMTTNTAVKQFSSSWTWSGGPNTTTDNLLKQLATQGQSYFQASGDSDAYDSLINVSTNLTVPVDSTNVTSVGATTLTMNGTGASWASETVWSASGGGSSGGVSTFYNIPPWQQGINMSANLGSTTKRNIPDVAMVGNHIWVIHDNTVSGGFSGTSCSAPLWAGFIALVNQQAAASSRPSVGLINSAIYAIGKGANYTSDFHDVTTGSNQKSGSGANFPAVTGYDLCTGWGTPNGIALITALAMPDSSLGIVPGSGFSATGTFGGPFSPNTLVLSLTNSGGTSLNWSAINPSPFWLNISPGSGTLAANGTTTVTASLKSAANTLAPGIYASSVLFSNATSGIAQARQFTLTVSPFELVQNGGFETGDFTGWTLAGDNSYSSVSGTVVVNGTTTVDPNSGNFFALLGTLGSQGFLSETLPTSPGQLYLVSFWFNSTDGTTPNPPSQFQASWNAITLTNLSNPLVFPGNGWLNLQFIATATGSSSLLKFSFQNDPSYFALDDVSVQPVPAPPFQTVTAAAGTITFTWNAMIGLAYQVQYKTNLAQSAWINLGSPITAASDTLNASDTIGPDSKRFYRLSVAP